MAKNIVYCADGTWNEPEEEENGVISPSNVFKIFLLLEKTATQVVEYDEGVGTASGIRDVIYGGLFGEGVFKKIQTGFEFLSKNYEPEDKIFLFGFSRGAYAIRVLAKIIEKLGLPKMDKCDFESKNTTCLKSQVNKLCEHCKRNQRILSELRYVFYPESKDRARRNTAKKEGKKFVPISFEERVNNFKRDSKTVMGIPIEMIGAWDTVERIGNPLVVYFQKLIHGIDGNFDIKTHTNVNNFYHALAIDEKRLPFIPTLVNEETFVNAKKNALQVWFIGCHSNIGGGYKNNFLSNHVLKWMVAKAKNHGLKVHEELLALYNSDSLKGTIRDEIRGFGGWLYFRSKILKYFRPIRKIEQLTKESSARVIIAKSVGARKKDDPKYKPLGCPDALICEIEEDIPEA